MRNKIRLTWARAQSSASSYSQVQLKNEAGNATERRPSNQWQRLVSVAVNCFAPVTSASQGIAASFLNCKRMQARAFTAQHWVHIRPATRPAGLKDATHACPHYLQNYELRQTVTVQTWSRFCSSLVNSITNAMSHLWACHNIKDLWMT